MPTLTIASDAIDVTGYSKALIETEGGAASDSLQTINGGVAGKLFYFLNTLNARNVTWKHSIGNIICGTGADFNRKWRFSGWDLLEGHNKWYVWPVGKDIDSIRNGELDVASATTTDVGQL
jgi:hypothetical protein